MFNIILNNCKRSWKCSVLSKIFEISNAFSQNESIKLIKETGIFLFHFSLKNRKTKFQQFLFLSVFCNTCWNMSNFQSNTVADKKKSKRLANSFVCAIYRMLLKATQYKKKSIQYIAFQNSLKISYFYWKYAKNGQTVCGWKSCLCVATCSSSTMHLI